MFILHQQITTNKFLEIQCNLFDHLSRNNIFEFNLTWTIKQDHAGPNFTVIIFGVIYFHIMIYDNRHWDWENNKWNI